MKLLLTSAGLTNTAITASLEKLLGKPLVGLRLAFIPTASNVELGSKDWVIEDLNNCQKAGFEVDIVDISALPKEQWLSRLEAADVILMGGGNTSYLMSWVQKSGLRKELPQLLETRIYVGISAGSCIAGPTIVNSVQDLFDEDGDSTISQGLVFVPFQIVPHLNSPYFPAVREKNISNASKVLAEPVYAIDDNSAIVVDGDIVEVVSQGTWFKTSPSA
jgi:dipeptidase E